MRNKVLFIFVTMFVIGIEAFAVKLPDGKNVRSDEVVTYDSGSLKSVKLREDTEITTSLGVVVADSNITVNYYENGNVKSLGLQKSSEKILSVESNLGNIEIYGKLSDYEPAYLTFYQSGSIWFASNAIAQIKTPKGAEVTIGELINYFGEIRGTESVLFYDSGSSEKIFLWKSYKTKNSPNNIEDFKYGFDGFSISFYKNGEIEKVYQSNYECETSLGKVFCGNSFPLMFWEDGSLKQCSLDDALLVDIYGKKVSIPVGGLLRFRKDGTVQAYTSNQKIQYSIGKKTYISNETIEVYSQKWDNFEINFDTVVFDDKGKICQLLKVLDRDRDESLVQVSDFYDSGNVKKMKPENKDKERFPASCKFLTENGKGYTQLITPIFGRRGVTKLQINPEKRRTNSLKGIHSEINSGERIYMLYFADDGYPSSYSIVKTLYSIDNPFDEDGIVLNEYKLPNIYCLLELTEESEFVIQNERIKNFKIIQD